MQTDTTTNYGRMKENGRETERKIKDKRRPATSCHLTKPTNGILQWKKCRTAKCHSPMAAVPHCQMPFSNGSSAALPNGILQWQQCRIAKWHSPMAAVPHCQMPFSNGSSAALPNGFFTFRIRDEHFGDIYRTYCACYRLNPSHPTQQ
jgi:hypothetical protein